MRAGWKRVLLATACATLVGCGGDRNDDESGQAPDTTTSSNPSALPTLPVASVAPKQGSSAAACDGLVSAVQGFGSRLFALNPGDEIDPEEGRELADAAAQASRVLADHAAALGEDAPEVRAPMQRLSEIYAEMAKVSGGSQGNPELLQAREPVTLEAEAACKATGWRG